MAALPMLGTGLAWADDCPPLDPTCVLDDTVNEDEVVEDTVDTVTRTIDPVEDTVDDVTSPPGGGGDPLPDGDGGVGNGGAGGHGGGSLGDGASARRGEPGGGRAAAVSSVALATGTRGSSDPSIVLADHAAASPRDLSERLVPAAAGIAKSLAVVFVLLGAVTGFVLIQNQLDKRDPRLALAPMRSDVVRFD
ncbi:MAG: hypothetical protein WEE66_09505 [Actinomycetota bacterium]